MCGPAIKGESTAINIDARTSNIGRSIRMAESEPSSGRSNIRARIFGASSVTIAPACVHSEPKIRGKNTGDAIAARITIRIVEDQIMIKFVLSTERNNGSLVENLAPILVRSTVLAELTSIPIGRLTTSSAIA